MWIKIGEQAVSAVLAAVIVAGGLAIWQSITGGGVIKALGGVTLDDIPAFVPANEPALTDLKIVSMVTAQNTPSPVLDCGEGWKATSARFHESYRDQNVQREKHFLICARTGESRAQEPVSGT